MAAYQHQNHNEPSPKRARHALDSSPSSPQRQFAEAAAQGASSDELDDGQDHLEHTLYRDSRSSARSLGCNSDEPDTLSPPAPETPTELHYRPKLVLRGHRKGVSTVKFSPDGRRIASCCKEHRLSGLWKGSTDVWPVHSCGWHNQDMECKDGQARVYT